MQRRATRAFALVVSLLLVSSAAAGPALAGQVLERVSVSAASSQPGGGPPGGGSGGGPGGGSGGGPSGGGPPGGESPGGAGPPTDAPAGDGTPGGGPGAGPSGGDGTPGGDGPPATPGGNDSGSGNGDGPPSHAGGANGPPSDDGNESPSDAPGSGPPVDVPAGPPAHAPGGPPTGVPGGEGSDETPGGSQSLNVTVGDIVLGPNATALDHRRAAQTLLAGANADGPGNSGGALLRRLGPLLNGTFEHVLDERRVLSARVFEDDVRVAAPLSRRAPNVTRHLVTSDRKLAAQAIDDAETVRSALDGRNVTYDAAAVAENISAARAALRQAGSLPEQANPAARISHYREAWTHAQRAIDVMDEAVAPTVTVESRSDLPHNESRTVNVTGAIFDVRPYELAGTLRVNGTARDLPLSDATAPLVEVAFNASVTLDRQWPVFRNGTPTAGAVLRTYTLNASVRDPGVDLADTGGEQLNLHEPQVAGGELHFDGDGLPGRYEETVAGTDPLDPDSDAAATNASEAGDGVIDGAEDLDGESLVTYREFRIGTDPLDPDTDGDDLTDAFEVQWSLDPLAVDSDADGVTDDLEDRDDDGLANAGEQRAGTAPVRNDTDRDGLEDGREVHDLGTDPLAEDTDADDITDPDELPLPTDPLVADTDGDGVLDGNETFTTGTADEETGASLSLTGAGNVAAHVSVRNVTGENTTDIGRGPAVYVENDTAFEEATIRVPIDPSVNLDREAENLALVKLEEGSGAGWQAVDATLDRANRTMVATVESFSAFVVVGQDELDDETSIDIPGGWPHLATSFDAGDWEGDATTDGGALVVSSETDDDPDEVDCGAVTADGDCDGDGLENHVEVNGDTEYDDPDTDDDGLEDGAELEAGTDPTAPDSDGDGVDDGDDDCPTVAASGPNGCPADGSNDQDDDGFPDSTDDCPDLPGTDQGCPTDERLKECIEDLRKDCDRDGIRNGDEPKIGTDPLDVDTDDDGVNDGLDDCPTTAGDGEQGCPTDGENPNDRDGDGVPDIDDDCPDTAGDGADGCPTDGGGGSEDSDGDGVSDSNDACPDTAGAGADGCPVDSDFDGITDLHDQCPNDFGPPPTGCPGGSLSLSTGDETSSDDSSGTIEDASVDDSTATTDSTVTTDSTATTTASGPIVRATREVNLGPSNEASRITVEFGGVVQSASAVRVLVVGSEGRTVTLDTLTETAFEPVTRSADLSHLAAGPATVHLVSEGDATAVLHEVELREDSDGDDIRDVVERETRNQDLHLWWLRIDEEHEGAEVVVFDEPVRTNLDDADTDGDDLSDSTETPFPTARNGDTLTVSAGPAYSHPSLPNTDGGGLTDGEEYDTDPRSNAFAREIVTGGYTVVVTTNEDGLPLREEQSHWVGPQSVAGGDSDDHVLIPQSTSPVPREYADEGGLTNVTVTVSLTLQANEAAQKLLDRSDDVFGRIRYVEPDDSEGRLVRIEPPRRVELGETRTLNYSVRVNPNEAGSVAENDVWDFGGFRFEIRNLDGTPFERSSRPSTGQQYAVPVSPLLPSTATLVEDTDTIWSKGEEAANNAPGSVGAPPFINGLSARVFFYQFARGELEQRPDGHGEHLLERSTLRGMTAFSGLAQRIHDDQTDPEDTTPVTNTVLLQN